jgi:hypothetical protein
MAGSSAFPDSDHAADMPDRSKLGQQLLFLPLACGAANDAKGHQKTMLFAIIPAVRSP